MGGAISVRNATDLTLTISLDQVGPLYYENEVKPNEVFQRKDIGLVWFTVSAWEHEETNELGDWSVAKPILAFTGETVLTVAGM